LLRFAQYDLGFCSRKCVVAFGKEFQGALCLELAGRVAERQVPGGQSCRSNWGI
jgi:hypothetical protein